MQRANVAVNHTAFNVEKNASFAMQVFNAYFRTPDPTGKTYAAFPEFFLIKPEVLEIKELPVDRQEKKSLEECKTKALAREGYIGVSKYFDEKFGYHWIKLSAFPFTLGEATDDNKIEFHFILNKFIEFTRKNPNFYGDLTDESETDNEMSLMLRDIRKNGERLSEKAKFYPEQLLVQFDPDWPVSEVKKLLNTLETVDPNLNQLFLERLRYVMRKKMGLIKTNKTPRQIDEALEFDRNIAFLVDERHAVEVPSKPSDETVLLNLGTQHAELSAADVEQSRSEQEIPTVGQSVSLVWPVQKKSTLEQEAEQALKQTKMRAEKIAQLSADTHSRILKAEEEKIRLEALAVVTARKQIAEAEAASKAAMERIELSQRLCLAEEEKAQELERSCKQNEVMAEEAALQRIELAERARREAVQRQMLERDLLEQEQLKLDQEQELRDKISQRLALLERANLVMQSRIQVENEAARLAQEKVVAEQVAAQHANVSVEPLEISSQEEAVRSALGGAADRTVEAGSVQSLDQEYMQNHVSETVGLTEPTHSVLDSYQVEPDKLITLDFKAHHPIHAGLQAIQLENWQGDDPFIFGQQSYIQPVAEAGAQEHSRLDHDDGTQARKSLSWKARLLNLKHASLLAKGLGLTTAVVLVGFLVFPFVSPDTAVPKQYDQSKPISYSSMSGQAREPQSVALDAKIETQSHVPETYITFATLKMTDHLRVVPSR